MRLLTEEQLAEVDRIINETPIATDWDHGGEPSEDSFEVDDAQGTLRAAAKRVRTYLSTL